ncbi:MAG TPA: acyl-CoA dehydrogenase family protein, partial [Hyphomonadaceae bacterium]|nr:acyl-CoA dehydrogenase family protein [Hyphomonadaceae bacterium]
MSHIELSEEQAMLLDQAASFAREAAPIARIRAMILKPEMDKDFWSSLVELGWPGISIPEAHGGVGLGLSEVAPVVELLGRHLAPSPLVATTLAAQALLANGGDKQKAEWLPKIAAGEVATLGLVEEDGDWDLEAVTSTFQKFGDTLTLSGAKCFVLDADVAELFVVSVKLHGQTQLVAITRDQLSAGAIARETVIDETKRSFRISLDGVSISASQVLPGRDLKAIERAALLLACAEISGGIAGALNVTVDY